MCCERVNITLVQASEPRSLKHTCGRKRQRQPPCNRSQPARGKVEYSCISIPPPNNKLQSGRDDPYEYTEFHRERRPRRSKLTVYSGKVRNSVQRFLKDQKHLLSFSRSASPLSTFRLSFAQVANWSCALVCISSAFEDSISVFSVRCRFAVPL